MIIETKYDVGQEVWFIEENKIKTEAIKKLGITKDEIIKKLNSFIVFVFK